MEERRGCSLGVGSCVVESRPGGGVGYVRVRARKFQLRAASHRAPPTARARAAAAAGPVRGRMSRPFDYSRGCARRPHTRAPAAGAAARAPRRRAGAAAVAAQARSPQTMCTRGRAARTKTKAPPRSARGHCGARGRMPPELAGAAQRAPPLRPPLRCRGLSSTTAARCWRISSRRARQRAGRRRLGRTARAPSCPSRRAGSRH
jgi:hypothetical protein